MITRSIFMRFSQRALGLLARAGATLTLLLASALAPAQTVTYFHNDLSGTPVLATDASGNVVWKENYQPYGSRLNNSAAEANNRLGFAGKPYDPGTGLSYMGARYYDPQLGRFMGVDPAPASPEAVHSINRYAYANNNPYRYVDPDGDSPITIQQASRVEASIQLYQQCKSASCVSSSLAGMVQVRDELRVAGVDLIDRSGISANIGQAAILLGDMGPALDATAGIGIVGLTQGAAKGPGKPTFPKTAKEMDQFLGMEGKRVPDTVSTPGRDKVVWQPNTNTKITLEQHPYHPNAPDWHRGPHYHVDTPGKSHERFLPGDKIPGF